MAGYIGSKAVNLSTTGADINGDANIDGTLTSDGLTVDLPNATDVNIDGTDGGGIQFKNSGAEQFRLDSASNDGALYHTPSGKNHTFKTDGVNRLKIATGGDISFYEDTGSTAKFFWDASAESLGIGTSSPSSPLQIQSSNNQIRLVDSQNTSMYCVIETISDAGLSFNADVGGAAASSRIQFNVDNSEKMRIDSSGNVGIGTSSPSKKAHLYASNDSASLRLENTANSKVWDITPARPGVANTGLSIHNVTDDRIDLHVDNSGNVGIGTSSVTAGFVLEGVGDARFGDVAGDDAVEIGWSGGGSYAFVQAFDRGATAQRDLLLNSSLRITSAGNVGIGTSSPSTRLTVGAGVGTEEIRVDAGAGWADLTLNSNATNGGHIYFNDGSNAGEIFYYHASDYMAFNTAASERMRIDSSGNVLVGKTSTGLQTTGHEFIAGGQTRHTRDGATVMFLNRETNDGNILEFYKDNSTVGNIGSNSGYLYIGSPQGNDAFLLFGADIVSPATSTGANRDNAIDLGHSSARFDDIYATNGTIQTSDRNEKQDIAELSDAEQRVAVAAKGLLRKFRWRDAVTERGDEARTHFGIIAQDLQAAFAAEGLDAGDYAMFISSTWTDENTGEERTRMGVRYSELLAFIIGAL